MNRMPEQSQTSSRNPSVHWLAAIALAVALPSVALPPDHGESPVLVSRGEPVSSIPMADAVQDFEPLDDEHVMLSTGGKERYVITLARECFGLRWARHVGVTASANTIWAGFDAVTADGRACPIREIHRVEADVGAL